jgi:uncharacterized lipoprotein YbaY
MIAVNLAGFFHLSQKAAAWMLRMGSGHIVNITATITEQPMASLAAALAALTKGGLNAITRSLAIEYASRHVRVNAMSRRTDMRTFCLLLFACLVPGSVLANDSGGISTSLLSRCAGNAGKDVRQGDPAFITIALDGLPRMTIERTETVVGIQEISTTVTSTGWLQRRDGTSLPFRFTCLLDKQGQAVSFHTSSLLHGLGDRLPPLLIVDGVASSPQKAPLPKGLELRVQLLDLSQPPTARIIAEQVVRSGWHVPIPFSLRLPPELSLTDRSLVISARTVLAHQTLFQLVEPRSLASSDLHNLVLMLEQAATSGTAPLTTAKTHRH